MYYPLIKSRCVDHLLKIGVLFWTKVWIHGDFRFRFEELSWTLISTACQPSQRANQLSLFPGFPQVQNQRPRYLWVSSRYIHTYIYITMDKVACLIMHQKIKSNNETNIFF